MEGFSRKRQSPSDDDMPAANISKRRRITDSEAESHPPSPEVSSHLALPYQAVNQPTSEDMGRDGLKRSISLVLNHVGFESAKGDALESFTEIVETYITGFVDDLQRTANAARRADAIPSDFDTILRRYNIPITSLKPHLKNPVSKPQLLPKFHDPIIEDLRHVQRAQPSLGAELEGRQEKETRGWIPSTFPGFPSKHSYKFTPVEPKARNTQGTREQAATDAKKGELALRRIRRAAKVARQKELREMAARNKLGKQRHETWENLMMNILPQQGGGSGAPEIADHSTIVDATTRYGRKEVPRVSRRAPTEG